MIPETENPQEARARAYTFFLKMPQNAAAAIDVMYRPDQPALSAQTDPADTFRLRGIDV